jgi:catechol 2,3-dioxygenase-like lactoylglutathione lyase family enzyme
LRLCGELFATKESTMLVHGLTPILNVSDMEASFAWFVKLGWKELWRWGDPVGFGAVGSGKSEIFLCHGGQGGRGKGANSSTFATGDDQVQDKGCWMSWWVEDVDAVYAECLGLGIEVTWPPTDMPWNVREMHIRHHDGHVFRVGWGL